MAALAGVGEETLYGFNKDELMTICDELKIRAAKSWCKDEIVGEILAWKRRNKSVGKDARNPQVAGKKAAAPRSSWSSAFDSLSKTGVSVPVKKAAATTPSKLPTCYKCHGDGVEFVSGPNAKYPGKHYYKCADCNAWIGFAEEDDESSPQDLAAATPIKLPTCYKCHGDGVEFVSGPNAKYPGKHYYKCADCNAWIGFAEEDDESSPQDLAATTPIKLPTCYKCHGDGVEFVSGPNAKYPGKHYYKCADCNAWIGFAEEDDESSPQDLPSKPKNHNSHSSMFTKMTKAQYRSHIANADPSLVNDGTHVGHIIASANGGADCRENYVMMNGALNLRLGNKGDHVMVFVVGIHKALAAVEASQVLKGYSGPSARELYNKGDAFFRDNFGAQARDRIHSKTDLDRTKEVERLINGM